MSQLIKAGQVWLANPNIKIELNKHDCLIPTLGNSFFVIIHRYPRSQRNTVLQVGRVAGLSQIIRLPNVHDDAFTKASVTKYNILTPSDRYTEKLTSRKIAIIETQPDYLLWTTVNASGKMSGDIKEADPVHIYDMWSSGKIVFTSGPTYNTIQLLKGKHAAGNTVVSWKPGHRFTINLAAVQLKDCPEDMVQLAKYGTDFKITQIGDKRVRINTTHDNWGPWTLDRELVEKLREW